MLKGILASLAANVLFGAVYYFAILLRPLEGEAMFGFRIVVVIPFILLAIILFKQQSAFADLLQKFDKIHRLYWSFCSLLSTPACSFGCFYGLLITGRRCRCRLVTCFYRLWRWL